MNKENPTQQPSEMATDDPAFGWTAYAEQINGRFAMAGFAILLVLEFFTKQDIITWLGLR
jgi:Chlorophyll A-B binding protein